MRLPRINALFLLLYVSVVYFAVGKTLNVPTESMEPTIQHGERVLIKNFAYGIPYPKFLKKEGHIIKGGGPKRGDIVNFRFPKDPSRFYIKRCIATPGDQIVFIDKKLYLRPAEGVSYMKKKYPSDKLVVDKNGTMWVKEPYKKYIKYDPAVKKGDGKPDVLFNTRVYTVKKGEYVMVGDNRDHSYDSRFWGPVPYKDIDGKMIEKTKYL